MAVAIKGPSIASQVVATNTTVNSSAYTIKPNTTELLARIKVSSRTDGTYTPAIQHSHDGSNWETLKAVTAITSNDTTYTSFVVAVDGTMFTQVRLTIVSTSVTTGATVEADLWHN